MNGIKVLEIKNILGISEKGVKIEAKKVNIISGATGEGKTTILDSMGIAYRNQSNRNQIVHKDAKKGVIYIEQEDGMEIKRIVNKEGKTTTLNVAKGELKVAKPANYLKSCFGELSFLPSEFMNRSKKDQRDVLLSMIPMKLTKEQIVEWFGNVSVNLDKHGLEIFKELEVLYYDKRKESNGEIKGLKANHETLLSKIPKDYEVDKWKKANVSDKYDEITDINKSNKLLEEAKLTFNTFLGKKETIENRQIVKISEMQDRLNTDIEGIKLSYRNRKIDINKQISELEVKISILKDEEEDMKYNIKIKSDKYKTQFENDVKVLEDKKTDYLDKIAKENNEATKYIDNNKKTDITIVEAELKEIDEMKSYIRSFDDAAEIFKSIQEKEKENKQLEIKLESARNKPVEILKTLDMPIEGMGINDDNNVTINGLDISNLSDGEKWKLVVKISQKEIDKQMLINPDTLKVICLDGFEKLNLAERNKFVKWAESTDYQYFITCVEDGELKIN